MKRSLLCLMLWNASLLLAAETEWTSESPREEARPQAVQKETGGHDGKGSLVLEKDGASDGREASALHRVAKAKRDAGAATQRVCAGDLAG
jgi:hypothetical protein